MLANNDEEDGDRVREEGEIKIVESVWRKRPPSVAMGEEVMVVGYSEWIGTAGRNTAEAGEI